MRNIIFISPRFFNLEDYIFEELKNRFDNVYFYDERINNSKLNKILLRKFPSVKKMTLDRYYAKIFNQINEHTEFIFVIKAENLPVWFLKKVKETYPNIILIHYMYDPISNYPKILEKVKYFDKCMTFDEADAMKYNWIHRPLFYPPLIDEYRDNKKETKYTGAFIGTLHSDRAIVMDNIKKNLPNKQKDHLYIYFYIPLYSMFYYGKYLKRNFKNMHLRNVSTTPIPASETYEIMSRSEFIIDIHHDNQTGLTARTLESIGMRKKLITTNPNIIKYDFFDPTNILVIDKNNVKIDKEWFSKPFEENEYVDYDFYSISGFITSIENIIREKR